jgi:hypothetical protein
MSALSETGPTPQPGGREENGSVRPIRGQSEIREGRRVLFTIRLVGYEEVRAWECFDADSGKDLARHVREYFIPDFSNWADPSSYQKAFQRLLRDLKAEGPTPHT